MQCMNFVSGMPVLFGWVMMGGPQAAFTSWTMVSIVSCFLALALAEIAASFPTVGGIYFWAFYLGGSQWGPFLGWITAVRRPLPGPSSADLPDDPLLVVELVRLGLGCSRHPAGRDQLPRLGPPDQLPGGCLCPRILVLLARHPRWPARRPHPQRNQPALAPTHFHFAVAIFFLLFFLFWLWFPIAVAGSFRPPSFVFQIFHNGINRGPTKPASDAYCWVISLLFGAWEFGGYDASAHVAEETRDASTTVARGMWLSTLSTTLLSIPTLILVLFCIQDFEALTSATYANNWAEFLVQVIGRRGATAILIMNWIDCTCATAAVILSAQRVTFALSRDNILPASCIFKKVSGASSIPVNAAFLVVFIAAAVSCTVLGSSVAFSAITATTVIFQNMSYLFVLVTRHTLGRSTFEPAPWNLGRLSRPIGYFSVLWIAFLSIVLLLPQVFPVTLQTLNYSPVCLGIVTSVSLMGWIFPFGWGGRHWFKGPSKTLAAAKTEGA